MTTNTPQRLATFAGFAFMLAASPAQSDSYVRQDLQVMAADMVIDSPPLKPLPYHLGDDFFLERQNVIPQNYGFEVRFFRIDDASADPRPWLPDRDNCNIFMTLVFKHLTFRGDRYDLGPLDDNHWLTMTPDGHFTPGHFLFVIEQDSAADATSERGDSWEVFRLARNLRDAYFKRGVRIEIDPRYGPGPVASPPDEETQTKRALDIIAHTISSKFNCYQPRLAFASANSAPELLLSSCNAGPLIPKG
jgi:hypothetical protein